MYCRWSWTLFKIGYQLQWCTSILRVGKWYISPKKVLHRTVLTIPATSALSRQVFPTVNSILNAKRIILPRENGEKIQMIHDNYSFLQGLTALWVPPEPQHLSHWSRECLKIFSQSRCFLLEIWLIEKRSILWNFMVFLFIQYLDNKVSILAENFKAF